MAWTAPKTWVVGEMVTAALLNTHIKANQLALSTHAHGGAAGDGSSNLTGLDTLTYDDQSGNPGTAGRLQRNGIDLIWGASNVNLTQDDASAGTPSLRSLGSGSTQAAAGNHSH